MKTVWYQGRAENGITIESIELPHTMVNRSIFVNGEHRESINEGEHWLRWLPHRAWRRLWADVAEGLSENAEVFACVDVPDAYIVVNELGSLDVCNGYRIGSRHRTAEAAFKAMRKWNRMVRRNNGRDSYLPLSVWRVPAQWLRYSKNEDPRSEPACERLDESDFPPTR